MKMIIWITNACAYLLIIGLGVLLLAEWFDVWVQ